MAESGMDPQGKPLWNAALYIRLSREDGNDVSFSVQHQRQRLLGYLAAHEGEFVLAGVYTDDGYTGTDSNRAGLTRMLADIRAKRVNCVIVKDPSRLSRNYLEAGGYMEQLFVELDVRFISLELPALDSFLHPEGMNSILVPILNVVNDDFCRQTSIKVRGVFNMKRAAGEFIGAFAPYGYRKEPGGHSLLVDEEAAVVVRDIYRWYVRDGLSKAGIVKRLNELGIQNPAAYKERQGLKYRNPRAQGDGLWSCGTVSRLLQNPVYIGHMVQGRSRIKSYKVHKQVSVPREEWFVVEDTHAPIIDRATFGRAQHLQACRAKAAQGNSRLYPLSGFVRCFDCKKAMTRRTARGHVYYACRTHAEKSRSACARHAIRLEKLEGAILAAIQSLCAFFPPPEAVTGGTVRGPGSADRAAAAAGRKRRELDKIADMTQSLYPDWKNGDITREEYQALKARFSEQADRLREEVRLLEERRGPESAPAAPAPHICEYLESGNIRSLSRGLMAALVKTVYVHQDGGITIDFCFADPFPAPETAYPPF